MSNCNIVNIIKSNNLEEFAIFASKNLQCNCYNCFYNKIIDLILTIKPKDYEKMFFCAMYFKIKIGTDILQQACKLGNCKIVKYLIEHNLCEPNISCLIEAIYHCHLDIMTYLTNECNIELYHPKDRGLFFFHGVQRNFGENFFDWLRKRGDSFTLNDLEKAKDNFFLEDITEKQEEILIEYYKKYFEYEVL